VHVAVLARGGEGVVEEAEQLLAAAVDDVDLGVLLGREAGVLAEQLGEPEDGVEGGAQLVAEVAAQGVGGAGEGGLQAASRRARAPGSSAARRRSAAEVIVGEGARSPELSSRETVTEVLGRGDGIAVGSSGAGA
jgi:hypothetical protein